MPWLAPNVVYLFGRAHLSAMNVGLSWMGLMALKKVKNKTKPPGNFYDQ
jgi:hypothetical protein